MSTGQSLVEQVYERILDEICDGTLPPNSRLIQDELAEAYEVSRQPVQQAMMLLRDRGFVADAPKRGVVVAPLDVALMRSVYQVREVLDGLSCRLAAQRGDADDVRARGAAFIAAGREAIAAGSISRQVSADLAFHEFIGTLSGNLVIGEVARPNLHHMRRIMGEILRVDRNVPADIWDEHAEILEAIAAHEAERAETLGRAHISRASTKFLSRLQNLQSASSAGERSRALTRVRR